MLLVLAFVGLLAFGLLSSASNSTMLQGRPAPNFELTGFNGEYNGQRFSLADMRGQVIVLNFWASWCIECEKEADLLEQAWRDYRGRGVWFIGVDYLDIDTEGLAYMERFNITYPNGPDIGSRIYQDYRSTGVPETFFIDKEGMIQHVESGPIVSQGDLYGWIDRRITNLKE